MLNFLTERFVLLLTSLNIQYKRYFFHEIDFNDKLIGILGARGVGKTTFLLQYLKEIDIPLNKKLYISADSIEMSNLSLFELAKEFAAKGGKVLAIDEIHKYSDFAGHLKEIYDLLDIKVLFSGLSALRLEHAKADLSRRAVLYRINGLSFREFLELKTGKQFRSFSLKDVLENHMEIAYEILKSIKPLEYFKEYLQYGFYPFYFENPNTYYKKLEETINVVIESDLPLLFKIDPKNIVKLKKLVKLICFSKPYELNLSKLAQKIEINRHTLYRYIEYLNSGNILTSLKPKVKGDAIFTKPEKIYLNNTNLNYCYCKEQKIGTIRETFVVSQLRNFYDLSYPKKGDILINNQYLVEIGGKNKDFSQIEGSGYLFVDDIEVGYGRKVPLWLIGFLY
ncbi:ATP-binding protein [Deferribacter autotrophicus]|uniref:ATP-binding protein n=1 Tax=Deferribacter autotrophicus TaxID=500465 RepID=A0A5A8F5D7_9BACT|nr:AAA family ATPase [Deferribacter autotrophicus]KAA0259354.1 ATP-binding protein [Deferribacter autotrophicus]